MVNGGTAKNYKGFLELADRAIATVEAELPGTVRYECFVDEATSRFVWHEAYADGTAILQHVQHFVESGIVEEIPQLVDFDFAVALGTWTRMRGRPWNGWGSASTSVMPA